MLVLNLMINCYVMTSVDVAHFDDEKNDACHDLLISHFLNDTTSPGKPTVQPIG